MKTRRDEEFLNIACNRLWEVRYALKGMSYLFESSDEQPIEKEDKLGLGQLLRILSRQVKVVEDNLAEKLDTQEGSEESE